MEGISLLVNLPLSELSTTPFFVMPPGLLSLAAFLRDKGETIDFLDLNVTKRKINGRDVIPEFVDKIRDSRPILIGVSVMVAGQFNFARILCAEAKKVIPSIVTVVGGAHVSQFPNDILTNCPEIDFVVMGEGENQAYACIQYAKDKNKNKDWPDGIAFRSFDGSSNTILPKISYINDVDGLPRPAYDLVDFEDYRHDTKTWHNPYGADLSLRVPIITSRGCPNVCNFCSVAKCMGLKYRSMTAAHVVDMIQMLNEKYGAGYFAIFDANFAEDTKRVIDICGEIKKRDLKLLMDLPTGLPINATAPDMIDALAEVGLIRTCISVETGDEFIRNKVMMKRVEQNEIFKVVNAIRRYPQIFLLADFVIGMPEDTKESLEISRQLIADLDVDDIALSIATPYPGTKLFDQCVQDKLFLPDITYDHLYDADWYSHANVGKFSIKPYSLDIKTLSNYKDQIFAMRSEKILRYKNRMRIHFSQE